MKDARSCYTMCKLKNEGCPEFPINFSACAMAIPMESPVIIPSFLPGRRPGLQKQLTWILDHRPKCIMELSKHSGIKMVTSANDV